MEYAEIAQAASAAGFLCRGGFHPGPDDGVPGAAADGTETLVVLGNAGGPMWRAFELAPSRAGGLDRWTRAKISALAEPMAARAFFPFDQPYPPFQRWAAKAENLKPSPLGILIHPEYGLWHAYRGALLFARRLALPEAQARPAPCETCAEKPCLTSCPVEAFAPARPGRGASFNARGYSPARPGRGASFNARGDSPARYDVPKCVNHVAGANGTECLAGGCLARRACPIGRDYAYAPGQARFHMEAFLRANRGKS